MYVISETITSANQIFTYDITSIPALAVDHSWEIESVNSIPDGSSCLVADASIVDKNTFTLKPCNADFSAYVLINLVFLDKVKINRRRRAIELRVDFTTHYIDKAIYITTSNTSSNDNLTVHFREPGGEFHYCIVGRDDTLPDITGDWKTVTGISSVRMTGRDHKMWIYTTKNEKYSVSAPIHVEIDDASLDPVTGSDRGYNVGGDIYGLLACGKIGQIAALENVFAGEDIEHCDFNLNETNLTEGCYLNLFGSSGLWGDTTVFQTTLPATVVPSHAYYAMFRGIRYLYGPSSIDASVLTGTHNFTAMFQSSGYMNEYPKDLKPLVLTPYCYSLMFNGATVNPAKIKIRATEYAEGCFKGMFASSFGTPNGIWSKTKPYSHASICESNETRALPPITATDFYEHSFEKAFANCRYIYTSSTLTMNIHKALERAFYEAFTLESWSNTSDIDLHSIDSFTNSYTGEIELGTDAFRNMFSYCKDLNSVKNMSLASRSDAQNAYNNWLFGCSSTGTYTYNYYLLEYAYPTYTQAEAEKLIRSDYYIPSGWDLSIEDPIQKDLTLSFANGYPAKVDGSLGVIDVGLNIGEGYSGYSKVVTITCTDSSNSTIFNQSYTLDDTSYIQNPYVVRITPISSQKDWNINVNVDCRFSRFGGSYVDATQIHQNISIPVDTQLSMASGYPIKSENLTNVTLGLLIGDGYRGNRRTITVISDYSTEKYHHVFNKTYTLGSSSYKNNPYIINIAPAIPSYSDGGYVIGELTTKVTYNVGTESNEISFDLNPTIDKTFEWVSNYPNIVDSSLGTVNLAFNIGCGYSWYGDSPTHHYKRTLNILCKNQDNKTVYNESYTLPINGTNTFRYTIHPSVDVLDSSLKITATITFDLPNSQTETKTLNYTFTITPPVFEYNVTYDTEHGKFVTTRYKSSTYRIYGKSKAILGLSKGHPYGSKDIKVRWYAGDDTPDAGFLYKEYNSTLSPSDTSINILTDEYNFRCYPRTPHQKCVTTVNFKDSIGNIISTKTDTRVITFSTTVTQ